MPCQIPVSVPWKPTEVSSRTSTDLLADPKFHEFLRSWEIAVRENGTIDRRVSQFEDILQPLRNQHQPLKLVGQLRKAFVDLVESEGGIKQNPVAFFEIALASVAVFENLKMLLSQIQREAVEPVGRDLSAFMSAGALYAVTNHLGVDPRRSA